MSVRLGTTAIVLALELVSANRRTSAQEPGIEVHVGAPLRPARIRGHERLIYELHVTNLSDAPADLAALDVLDAGGKSLLSLAQQSLRSHMDMEGRTVLGKRARAVVYLTVDFDGAAPTAIRHRLVVKQGETERAIATADVAVEASAASVIAPPLKGGPWVAVYSDEWARGHRRVFYATAGHAHLPGRFAIDWMKVDVRGRTLTNDSGLTSSSLSYGAEVLAVADARVVAARGDVTEATRIADNHAHPHPDAAGNFISLALLGGRFATYEHLRPGSLKVAAGDEVRAGQVLAEVGFSGDSTEPHLHFHVSDSPRPLEGEGMPYALSRLYVIGQFKDWHDFGRHRWQDVPPRIGNGEFPDAGDVIEFKRSGTWDQSTTNANHAARPACNESSDQSKSGKET